MTSQARKQQLIILSLAYPELNYYELQQQKTTSASAYPREFKIYILTGKG